MTESLLIGKFLYSVKTSVSSSSSARQWDFILKGGLTSWQRFNILDTTNLRITNTEVPQAPGTTSVYRHLLARSEAPKLHGSH